MQICIDANRNRCKPKPLPFPVTVSEGNGLHCDLAAIQTDVAI